MSTFYTIDCGNTQIKVAAFSSCGELQSCQRISYDEISDFNLPKDSTTIVSSVRETNFTFTPTYRLKDLKSDLDFKSHYSHTLGDDRIAICYYLQQSVEEPLVVIDAGSFITVDYIRDGMHQGGHIYPGVQNFLNIYRAGEQLPTLEYQDKNEQIPTTTNSAIRGATENYLKGIIETIPANYQIIVTGGDAQKLIFKEDIQHEPHLMAKALLYIVRQVSP